ncbi:uncharacterized protein LOC133791435 [Humulus lupulus]|uniref:uncharacterized protein LOC133791435 n=1 Tax=Humulus lupulus TaxID=3486 RepID=UPI002B40F7F9|nr:uncharacterized protein LOC133791435 [Humulus lupulus]
MENQGIALDFALWLLRHENTSRTLEELHCVASTKWKDIENQLDSTRKGLKALFEQLVQQENELLSKEKQLEAKELELKQLDGMQKSSQELSKEIEQKKKQCHDIEIRIKEKEREFEHINSSVLDAENKLDSLQSCMQEQSQKYQGMMKEYEQVTELKEDLLGKKQREIELKEDLLGKKQRSLEECIKEIELKEDLLSKKQRSIAKCTEDYELKKEQLELRESFIDGYNKEIKLKEEELKLKKHQLDLVQKLKAENSDSLEKLMENCACKLEKKEKNFKKFVEELSLKEQFLESKFKELDLLDKKVNECVEEVELKETNFASLQRLLEEQCHELEIKESEFERKANEFKLRQEEFEAIQRSAEMGVKEKTNIQTPSSSASHQSCVTKGKKDLFWLLHEYLQRHDLVCSQILSVLKASSSDPARLVLDTIHKIHNLHSSREDIEFEGSIARRGCSLLSELLIKASPEINPQVRQKAMKLAFAWKAKLNVASDNFEVLSLLQFLNSFRLASAFDVNELHYLLDAAGLITQTSQLRSPSSDITREECVQTLIQGGEIIRAVRLICN